MDFLTFFKGMLVVNIVIDVVSFYPQIQKLIKSERGSTETSILMWALWTYTTIVWLVYVIWQIDDIFALVVAACNVLGCAVIMLLAIWNQHFRFKEKM